MVACHEAKCDTEWEKDSESVRKRRPGKACISKSTSPPERNEVLFRDPSDSQAGCDWVGCDWPLLSAPSLDSPVRSASSLAASVRLRECKYEEAVATAVRTAQLAARTAQLAAAARHTCFL